MAQILWTTTLGQQYTDLFNTAVVHPDKVMTLRRVGAWLSLGRPRYEAVAAQIGCPWWFVGLVHYIECGFWFDRHLHNGDPLKFRTVHVPAGRPVGGTPPFTWEQSALDALRLRNIQNVKGWTIGHVLYLLEGYNGFGYRQYHPTVLTPYLWSWTNHYTKGKYTADGHFDAECVSEQAGLAAVIKQSVIQRVITL